MTHPDFYTDAQIKISFKNHGKLHKKLNPPKGYILHHKDEAMRYTNPDRYIKWLEEDIEILSKEEHTALHFIGYHHTDEAKKKIGEASKGNTNTKGRKWFNDGTKSVMAYECPEGFVAGRISWKVQVN